MIKKSIFSAATFALFILLPAISFAQNIPGNDSIPFDPSVRMGVLSNGMHYYIRANKLPEKRAEFYIAHNVGAIQEEDNQNGLAHFTEHMAFNGTENFKGKGILNYLETIGVKFGENVNAYTSIESTVYNLSNVPLLREGIIDTALLILHDWSNYISFVPEEIEMERGVINEEWRMYGTADIRMRNELAPVIFKGSKFAVRNVLGDTAVIRHFEHQVIRDFYHKWYRSDLQAVIIVGDFDTDVMESKIKTLFSTIPAVVNPQKKESYEIPDNSEPLIGIASDKEATRTVVALYFKHDEIANKNLEYVRTDIVRYLAATMLNERFNEIIRNENPPFMAAGSAYSSFAGNKDVFAVYGLPKQNESIRALKGLLTETERMRRFGFIQAEMERAKANLMRMYETSYKDRDNRKNSQLIYPILSFFLENEPNPGIEYEFDFMKKTLPEITLEEINKTALGFITDNNIILTVTGPDKEGVSFPTVQELKDELMASKTYAVEPYVEKLAGQKLIKNEPMPGKVVNEIKNPVLGTTEWTLSNGMKVVFKTTDFNAEQVIMEGFSKGGLSQVKDEDLVAASMLTSLVSEMGTGNFSSTDLTKLLAGKKVSTSISVASEMEKISGNFSISDIETQLQLVYLAFTKPRWNETEYNTWLEKVKENYKNMDADPRKAYSDTISQMLSSHHKRAVIINYDVVSGLKSDNFKRVYNERFCDPGNFTFIFTGKISPEEAKPYVEKYLASLLSVKRKEEFKDNGIRIPKGKVINDFKHETTTPRTSVFVNYSFKFRYSADELLLVSALRHILELRYTEAIREDNGGTYSVYVGVSPRLYPYSLCNIQVVFETDPAKADDLIKIVNAEIDKIIENGPREADLQKAKEFFLKSRSENIKDNKWWAGILSDYYYSSTDKFSGYEKKVQNITTGQIQKYAKSKLSKPDICTVIMRPL